MAEEKKKMLVVERLPEIPSREIDGNDGNRYELITLTEAVQEILEISRELKKGITG